MKSTTIHGERTGAGIFIFDLIMKETRLSSETTQLATDREPMAKLVAEHPLLCDLDPHSQRILSDCAMLTSFKAGESIFREGEPANRFYLILEGTVSLESYIGNSERLVIQTIGPGDVLGWSWLFPPYYWQFDACAVEDARAIFFYATPLREECEADHDLGYELMKRMAAVMLRRLQATRRQLLKQD